MSKWFDQASPSYEGCPDLVVVGSFSCDHLENAFYGSHTSIGGAGGYAALAATLTGAHVGMVGIMPVCISRDKVGLIVERIDCSGLSRTEGVDIVFDIAYDRDWNATYNVDGVDAERSISPRDIPSRFAKAGTFHLCPVARAQTQVQFASHLSHSANGVLLSATTFKHRIEADCGAVRDLVKLVDLFFLNAEEALLLTSSSRFDTALDELATDYPLTHICVTLGCDGAILILPHEGRIQRSAFQTTTKDPTGAGESFAGGFVAEFSRSRDPERAIRAALCVSSLTVEEWGLDGLIRRTECDLERRIDAYKSRPPDHAAGEVAS